MPGRDRRVDPESAHISYSDAYSWMLDFAQAYGVRLDLKLTVRKERDGAIGTYITVFAFEKGSSKSLRGSQVVRYGRDQDAVTVPAAIIRALVLLDRDLGSRMDDTDQEDFTSPPDAPIL